MLFSQRNDQRHNSQAARRHQSNRRFRPQVERLEDRLLLATVNWIGGSGDWDTVANWSDGATNRLPGADDDAIIDVAGISVTHLTGTHTVQSLTINDPFSLSGGTLIVTGNLLQQNANTFTMEGAGGTLRSATVVGGGGAVLVAGNGTLDGVTLGATVGGVPVAATVQSLSTDGSIIVNGGLTFANGSVLDLAGPMFLDGDQTWGGDGEILSRAGARLSTFGQITFGTGLTTHLADPDSSLSISMSLSGASITNHGTIRADAGGTLEVNGPAGSTFTNAVDGVLSADVGSLVLSAPWSNAGQIVVRNNATLFLGGSFTTDGIGSITRTGSTIYLSGLLDNTGHTFSLDATRGTWILNGGTLRRGSLVTSGGEMLVGEAGTLDGVTLGATVDGVPASATVQVPATSAATNMIVKGGLSFANGSVVDLRARMTLRGNQTLGGDGEIRFGVGSQILSDDDSQITFGPGLTIHCSDACSGDILLQEFEGGITNQATIRADAGGQIHLSSYYAGPTFTNGANGVLSAAGGGTLFIDNNFRNTPVITNYAAGTLTGGTWQATGNSTLRITGADITTSAATIVLDGAGAKLTKDTIDTSALANLSNNAAAGSLTIRNGVNFQSAGSFANNGSLTVGPASTFTTNGAFTQGSAASLAIEIGGAPAGGQFGRLVTTGTAALDGTLDVRLVNGYGPDPGLSFPISSFASRTSDFATISGLSVGGMQVFEALVEATSLTLNSVGVRADLAFVSVSPTTTIIPGQPVSVPYTVENMTGTPAVGDWTDSLYLSTDGVLDPSDVLLGRFEHHGGLAGNASYTETLTATVPAMSEGNYRVIALADSHHLVPQGNRANDAGASAGTTSLTVPVLTLGGSFSGTIANGQDLYYRLDVPAGRDVQIAADFTTSPAAELVERYSSLPDRTTYDRAAPNLLVLHPQIVMPTPQAGRYYILLHGREGSGAGQPFTLGADFVPLMVSTIAPNHGSNAGQATTKLTGSGFTPSTDVSLLAGATTRSASRVQFVDGNTLFVTFDLTNLEEGAYDVQIVESAQTAVSAGAFTVSSRAPAKLRTSVHSTALIRDGRTYPVRIDYINDGDTDLPAPLLTLRGDNAVLRFPGESEFRGSLIQVLGINHDGPAGILPPGYHGSVTLEFNPMTVAPGDQYRLNLFLVGSPDDPVNWDDFKAVFQPAGVPADAWDANFANFTARVGNTLGQYQSVLGEDATYLSQLQAGNVSDVSRLLGFELRKTNSGGPLASFAEDLAVPLTALLPQIGDDLGFYQQTLATESYLGSSFVNDSAFPAPGIDLQFSRVYSQTIAGRYNVGALGRGWTHSWDIAALIDGVGNVTVQTPAGQRPFVKQPDGSFRARPGDLATLTLVADEYRMRTTDGHTLAFFTDAKLKYVQDRNGNRVTAVYTGERLTSLTHSDGDQLLIGYDTNGRINQLTGPDGRVETYAYDAAGDQLASVTDQRGTTQYEYATGQGPAREHALTSIAFPGGTHTLFSYDSLGRLTRQSLDGGDQAVDYAYLDAGAVRRTDATGRSTTLFLDDHNFVAQSRGSGQATQLNILNVAGSAVQSTVSGIAATTVQYDAQQRVVGIVDASGQGYAATYEASFGNLTALTDALGRTLAYTYDVSGNLQRQTSPDGTFDQFQFDSTGNVTQSATAAGRVIDLLYDARGLLTRKDYQDGSHVDFTYDAHGNLLTATDVSGMTSLQYDSADRFTKITYPSGRFLQFTYDTEGQRTRMTDETGFATNYAYDAVGRLTELTDASALRIVAYEYDNAGRLTREVRGNGTFTTYEYDSAGRVEHLVHHAPDTSVSQRFDYTYDALSRRTSTTTLDGTTTYAYDAVGQLTGVVLPGGRSIQYQYDAAGNRISATDDGVVTAYTTNFLNQYTAVGSATHAYDLDGNLRSTTDPAGTTTYTYNADNRLVLNSGPAGTWSYEYDALGNRVATVHDGVQTEYLVDPTGLGDVVAEYTGAGSLVARYTIGLGLTSRIDSGGAAAYYNFDALGSTAQLTGADGAMLDNYSYLPFGEMLSVTGTTPNPFTFVGQAGVMNDDSGLYFMRQRFYGPAEGRFSQRDPINLSGGDANMYRYVANDVANTVDPSGLKCKGNTRFSGGVPTGPCRPSRPPPPPPRNPGHCTFNPHECSVTCTGREANPDRFFGSKCDEDPPPPSPPPTPPSCLLNPFGCSPPPGPGPGGSKPGGGSGGDTRAPDDPNDIVGPAGFGAEHFVAADLTLDYAIEFENKPTATAPAQVVVITEQLDSDLDFTTFELGDFGFGATLVQVPVGRNFFSTRIDARATVGLFVDFTAGIDLSSGLVTWTFRSLEPDTLDLPFDALAGFLPPNDAAHSGEGFVSYHLRPRTALATGTEIRSVAVIVFDTNAPIATNQINPDDPGQGTDPNKEAPVTLDAGPPTSTVNPLPAVSKTATFPVSWSATDDADGATGSGIATFDVFVSDNGGPFALWLNDTTNDSAPYTGQSDHTYQFYSVATDNVGHVDSTSATVQAVTTIDTTAPLLANMPPDQTIEATMPTGAVATFTLPTASDNLDPNPTVSCSPLSGSTFALGTTSVTCTATDDAGNSASANFAVTVQDTRGPTVTNVELVRDARRRKVTRIVVTFNEAVRNANDLANYILTVRAGRRRKPVALISASYDAASASVTLVPLKAIPVTKLSAYVLTIRGDRNLTDTPSNLLDGDADGNSGGDFVRPLSDAVQRTARQAMVAVIDALLDSNELHLAMPN